MSTITPNPNPRPNNVVWAQDNRANLKEPIQALKEKGWQLADVPTASNFNWLFNELAKWDQYLERRIDGTSEELYGIIMELKNELKTTRRDLKLTVTVLSALLHKVIQHHPEPRLLLPKLPDIED